MGNAASNIPYNVAGNVPSYTGKQGWTLHTGTKKENSEPVSIFKLKKDGLSNSRLEACTNALNRVKTIRHPNTLTYLEGVETDKEVLIVTEPVTPLQDWLQSAKETNSDEQYEAAIAWGLRCVCGALSFLANDCKLVHGLLSSDAIFVTPGGDWKLGRMDLVAAMERHGPQSVLTYNHELLPQQYRAPERLSRSWTQIAEAPLWAMDMWSLGCLVYEVFNGPLNRAEDTQNMRNIPQSLKTAFKRLLASRPAQRPNPKKILSHPFFRHDLVETLAFLDEISIKEPDEKAKFFQALVGKLAGIPSHVCIYKILPLLKNSMSILPGTAILMPMLAIGKMMEQDEELYVKCICPTLVELYKQNDRGVRVNLLQQIESYKFALDLPCPGIGSKKESLLNSTIFECILTGFRDSAPQMREITLKTIPAIVSMLNSKNLNAKFGGIMMNLLRDPVPGIRVNATILLGILADKFDESTKKKLLLPGFTRALQDPFPHNRAAALKALTSTHKMYEASDACAKILPVVVQRLMDDVHMVRDPAFACLKQFMSRIETISGEMTLVEEEQNREAEKQRKEEEQHKKEAEAEKKEQERTVRGNSYGSAGASSAGPTASTAHQNKAQKNAGRFDDVGWGDDDDDDDFFSGTSTNTTRKASRLDMKREKANARKEQRSKSSRGGNLSLKPRKNSGSLGSLSRKNSKSSKPKSNAMKDDIFGSMGMGDGSPAAGTGWDDDDDIFGSEQVERSSGSRRSGSSSGNKAVPTAAVNEDPWGDADDDLFGGMSSPPSNSKKLSKPASRNSGGGWDDADDDLFGDMMVSSTKSKPTIKPDSKKKKNSIAKMKQQKKAKKGSIGLKKSTSRSKPKSGKSAAADKDDFFGEFGF